MQFFLIFLVLIFVVCVQILKHGLKKWEVAVEGKFSQPQRKFRSGSEIEFSLS